MPNSTQTPASPESKAKLKSKSKLTLALLGLVAIALAIALAFWAKGYKGSSSAQNPLAVEFGLPTFTNLTEQKLVQISLPIFTNTPLDSSELESKLTIDSAPLPPNSLQQKSEHEWSLIYKLPLVANKKELLVKFDAASTTITLESSALDSGKSAKVLGARIYGKQKAIEVFLDRDLGLDSAKAQGIIKVAQANYIQEVKALVQGSKITLTGDFEAGETYKLSFSHPIQSEPIELTSKRLYPSLRFAQEGSILSSSRDVKLGVISTNIRKSTLTVYKLSTENLRSDSNIQSYITGGSGYLDTSSMDKIWEKEITFDLSKDEVQSALVLSELLEKDLEQGAYVLEFKTNRADMIYPNESDEEEDYYYGENEYGYRAASKLLVISNIALVGERAGDTITAYALNATTGEPLSGVKLSLYSTSNKLMESKSTDSSGYAEFSAYKSTALGGAIIKDKDNEPSKDFSLKPAILIAESSSSKGVKAGEISYLGLRYDGRFTDGRDTGGGQKRKRKVFTYTDRGIANPGESIQLNAIVRDERIQNAPIKLSIYNPRGSKILKDHIIQPLGYGLYSYTLPTDSSFITGGYRAEFGIGSEKFYKNFQVEYITPNKIRVDIDAPKSLDSAKTQLEATVQSAYLTGASAQGLKYKLNLQATPLEYKSSAYKDFDFSQSESETYRFDKSFDGVLDESGNARFSFNLSSLDSPYKHLRLALNAQVLETTGHPVSNVVKVQYFGSGSIIGVGETPRYIDLLHGPLELPLVVLNPFTDKPVANKTIRYKIYCNNRYWWFDYDVQKNFSAKIKSDINTKLIKEGTLTSTNAPFSLREDLTDLVEDYDSVFVELDDGENPPKVVWLVADMYGDAAIKANPMQLPLELDKSAYEAGEKASVRFSSKGFSKAIITLSQGDAILKSEMIDISGDSTSYEIPLAKEYAPNIYASVLLIAKDPDPLAQNTQNPQAPKIAADSSSSKKQAIVKRSFGLVNIPVQDPALAFTPEIIAPESIKPASKLQLTIQNPRKRKMAYTLAIVDEGILGIINFQTPNPLKGLYSKIGHEVIHYDNFDDFMARLFGVVHQSVMIGGDEESLGKASDFSKKRRENLIYFTSALSDESGKAVIEYQLPNFVGRARVMVVASDEGSVGHAESSIKIAEPANLYSNIPEEMKREDTIIAPVEVLAQDGAKLKGVEIEVGGDVAVKKLESSLDEKGLRFMQYLAITPKTLGDANITIAMKAQVEVAQVEAADSGEMESNGIDSSGAESKGVDSGVAQGAESKSQESKSANARAKKPRQALQTITQSNSYAINISTPMPQETSEELFTLSPKESKALEAKQPYLPSSLSQRLIISPSMIFSYQDKVEYLLHYLYGCIEQSVSATMPLLLGLQGTKEQSEEERREQVQHSINRIVKFQRGDGGFGYWIDSSESNLYGSDYAALFLLLAKSKGYQVPESTLKNWSNYATRRVESSMPAELAAYPLFLLALQGTPYISAMNELYTHGFKQLSLRAKLALAASYKLSGLDEVASEIRAKLPKNLLEMSHYEKRFDDSTAYRERYFDRYYYYGSALTNQAMSAYFLSLIDKTPPLELLHSIAKTLERERWLGTQDIATSLLAISAESKETDKGVRFVLNGKEYSTNKPMNIALDPTAKNTLVAKDKLYLSLISTGVPDVNPLSVPEQAQNLALSRRIFAIDKAGQEMAIDPSNIRLGDEFYIELKIANTSQSKSPKNLALTQIIPTGWEIQNTRIKRETSDNSASDNGGNSEETQGDRAFMKANERADYMDILRDRVMFFFDDELGERVSGYGGDDRRAQVVYIKCVATLTGEYVLGGAFAEAMYDRDFIARTPAQAVRVSK